MNFRKIPVSGLSIGFYSRSLVISIFAIMGLLVTSFAFFYFAGYKQILLVVAGIFILILLLVNFSSDWKAFTFSGSTKNKALKEFWVSELRRNEIYGPIRQEVIDSYQGKLPTKILRKIVEVSLGENTILRMTRLETFSVDIEIADFFPREVLKNYLIRQVDMSSHIQFVWSGNTTINKEKFISWILSPDRKNGDYYPIAIGENLTQIRKIGNESYF